MFKIKYSYLYGCLVLTITLKVLNSKYTFV